VLVLFLVIKLYHHIAFVPTFAPDAIFTAVKHSVLLIVYTYIVSLLLVIDNGNAAKIS